VGLFSSALSGFRVAGKFQSGRRAFLAKKYEEAVKYFQRVAQSNPDYIFVSGNFRESIWTFIGRAQYYLSQFGDARQSLERAILLNPNDCLAKLFLGLTFARENDYSNGQREIESGLRGLYDWIGQANSADPFNVHWDPQREIRVEIEKCLAKITNKGADWQEVIANGEWLGQRMEDEIDQVQRDEGRRFSEES
jgi:tetratricopeptide (TPR) repeat protein